jgi:hypothetical protein
MGPTRYRLRYNAVMVLGVYDHEMGQSNYMLSRLH